MASKCLCLAAVPFLLLGCLGCGFGICESAAGYSVTGTVLSAGSSDPVVGAEVSVVFLRGGEVISVVDIPESSSTNDLGEFQEFNLVDRSGGLCGFLFPAPRFAELGDPPDEVRLVVTVDGQSEEILVMLDADSIDIESSSSGTITIPPVEIAPLAP